MTPEELAAIRKATEEATKGPWAWEHGYGEMCNDPTCPFGALVTRNGDYAPAPEVRMEVHGFDVKGFEEADATFIANARTWVPQLLEYIEDLHERLEFLAVLANRDKLGTIDRASNL